MLSTILRRSSWVLCFAASTLMVLPLHADDDPPTASETIQVTATRLPEDPAPVPVAITVLSGEDLLDRGATDLASALALVGGVTVAPGGDGGPAGSVPEIWGLREFDAFLLVVDGVPWGGAFNPALTSLDLSGVERIEILRGAAPVMYGATSFVGVIHVIHYAAGTEHTELQGSLGNFSSGSLSASTSLPALGSWRQSLAANAERRGFEDDRTGFDRGQFRYRGALERPGSRFHLDVSGTVLEQDPASPHARQGRVLSPLVPLDANHNPKDAQIDENRFQLNLGFDHDLAGGTWSTTAALTHSERDTVRGFLQNLSSPRADARGYEQDLGIDDLYFESHWAKDLSPAVQIVVGLDHLAGKGEFEAETFDYQVGLDGSGAPSSRGLARLEAIEVESERNFSGLFAQARFTPTPRLRFDLGLRLNRTAEDREGEAEPIGEEEEPGEEEGGRDSRTTTRGSGSLGISYLALDRSGNAIWVFADYRDTYKPAAIDFGPEAEGEILKPETATSYEIGFKGRHLGDRLSWQVSAFQMDFENLVLSQLVNGLPALVNAGTERFKGIDLELDWKFLPAWTWELSAARHSSRFQRYTRLFDGVPFVLDGNRLELAPKELAATGLRYSPQRGLGFAVEASYVGDRYLNQRNTALAPSYTTWGASLTYRLPVGQIRLDGSNLNDTRPPVAESELGDAQYYRLPARTYRLSWVWRR